MSRVSTLKEVDKSLQKHLKEFGGYSVDNIFSEGDYWVFELLGKNNEEKIIKVKAIRG